MIDFPIIDSHIHLLDQKRFGYAWASGAPALKRDWTPDELARSAKPYDIEGLVFVEVDVDMPQYLDEAEWVDGVAKRDPRVLGAVACLPLEQGGAIEPQMARIAKLSTIRGVRRLIQNQPDPEFMLKPDFLGAMRLLPKYNLSFDVCIFHSQMSNSITMMRLCPEVAFVLDHIGKPGIKAGLIDPWRTHIREMAALPNVMCKLSGVTTEADHRSWNSRSTAALHRSRCRMLRPRPHSLRRGLAGVRTCRQLPPVARDARLGDSGLFEDREAQAFSRQRRQGLSPERLMDAAALRRKGYSVASLRALARNRLPRMVFDMVDGGAGDEITMRRNEQALAEIELVPKLLEGAPKRDQSVELFGVRLPSPIVVGPTGLAGLLWPHAELAAARAAARFGTIYSTSHASTATLEAIGAATPAPKWMQVFLYKDRGLTAEFAARAAAAGYGALILTVDNQVVAGRDRDARNGLSFPLRWGPSSLIDFISRPGWLWRMRETPSPTFVNYGERTSIGAFGPLMAEQLDPAVEWRDVEWLRGQWTGPFMIKGLLHPDEARRARGLGADAIVVSNHGGRQLDGAVPSIIALPAVVDALEGAIPVLVDGGFRRGVDVVKAIALGARAVMLGRPHLWGVACAGEEGVFWVLELFRREIDRAMALGSWDDLGRLDRSVLRHATLR